MLVAQWQKAAEPWNNRVHKELSKRVRKVAAKILAALWQSDVCELKQTELEEMFVGLLILIQCKISNEKEGGYTSMP